MVEEVSEEAEEENELDEAVTESDDDNVLFVRVVFPKESFFIRFFSFPPFAILSKQGLRKLVRMLRLESFFFFRERKM